MKDRYRLAYYFPSIFIPLLFVTAFTIPDQKAVTNIFRILICLPVLFLFKKEDLRVFFKESFFKVFLIVIIYTGLTLFLSDGKETNISGRLLASFLFTYLLYLWCRYNPKHFNQLHILYLTVGFLSVTLVLFNWEGMAQLDRWTISYGILDHHSSLSWFFATCAILALGHSLEHKDKNRILLLILYLAFSSIVLLSQARGGLLVLILGSILVSLNYFKSLPFKTIITFLFGLSFILLLIISTNYDFFMELIDRGDAGRFSIYQNAWEQITTSSQTFILGHGAGASTDNYIGSFEASHFHNLYLNTWFYTGLLGLTLNLALFFLWFNEVLARKCISPWDAIVISMLVAFLFDGTRWYGYPESIMFSFFIPLIYSFLLKKQDRVTAFVTTAQRLN